MAAVALGSWPLKRPKKAMVGAWSGLDNRPVHPASRIGPMQPSGPQVFTVVAGGTTAPVRPSGPGPTAGARRMKGMRRGSPIQRQRRNRLSQLPADRRGGRDPVRVAQDGVPLGRGRQAAFPENPGGHRRYPEAEIRDLAAELREEVTA